MINSMFAHLNTLFWVVTFLVILIIGGGLGAYSLIRKELKKEFVTLESCLSCTNDIKKNFHQDIDKKYDEVKKQIKENRDERVEEIKELREQIQKNHDEWAVEVKEIRKDASNQAAVLARMDGKLDLILEGRK